MEPILNRFSSGSSLGTKLSIFFSTPTLKQSRWRGRCNNQGARSWSLFSGIVYVSCVGESNVNDSIYLSLSFLSVFWREQTCILSALGYYTSIDSDLNKYSLCQVQSTFHNHLEILLIDFMEEGTTSDRQCRQLEAISQNTPLFGISVPVTGEWHHREMAQENKNSDKTGPTPTGHRQYHLLSWHYVANSKRI